MARESLTRSDVSGDVIPEGTGARVRVMFNDPSRADRRADLTDAEVEKLLSFTVEVIPRMTRRGGPQSRFES